MELIYIKVEVTFSHGKSKQTQLEEVNQDLVQSQSYHLQVRDSTALPACFSVLFS